VNVAAASLLAANRRRKKVRFWVSIATLPIALVGLLLALKLLTMYAFAHNAILSHVTGNHSGTVNAAQGQEFLNIVERYKAPFNVGVGLVSNGQLEAGRAKFEEALSLAEGLEVCQVRVNLALTIERMGDVASRAGKTADAMALYAEALVITIETPEECGSEDAAAQSSDPDRDMGETLDDLEDRLREKQQSGQPDGGDGEEDPQEGPDGGEGEEEQPTTPSQDQLDEIEDRLTQGADERDQYQQGGDDEVGGGNRTDKPW
jgi:hypothetical protein